MWVSEQPTPSAAATLPVSEPSTYDEVTIPSSVVGMQSCLELVCGGYVIIFDLNLFRFHEIDVLSIQIG
jgi:hypothetical protein